MAKNFRHLLLETSRKVEGGGINVLLGFCRFLRNSKLSRYAGVELGRLVIVQVQLPLYSSLA
jgi:hypothetical protein